MLAAVLLLAISFSVYFFSAAERSTVFRQRLSGRAHNAAQIFYILGDTSQAMLQKIDASNARFFTRKSIRIYDEQKKRVYAFNSSPGDGFEVDSNTLDEIRQRKEYYFKIEDRDAFGQYVKNSKNTLYIVIAAYDTEGLKWLNDLKKILAFSMLGGLLLSFFIGNLFSRQLIKPISNIIEEVNNISTHNLSQRIDAGSGQDELFQLANTFNDLLDRMQESFTIQRRFISNASHELSTPLTSISSQLEVSLQKNRTEEEYRTVMLSVQEDVQEMRQLTKSLLEIAKTGHKGSIELDEIRLDEVLLKVTSSVQKLSNSYQVLLNFDEFPEEEDKCLVFGNADLLFSALKNIVENGCKYSPDHTSRVTLRFTDKELTIEISNQGDVIELEEIERIFLPFYRSPHKTHQKGFGLGLALAKRIIGLHKGRVDVSSAEASGTIFRVILPAAAMFR